MTLVGHLPCEISRFCKFYIDYIATDIHSRK